MNRVRAVLSRTQIPSNAPSNASGTDFHHNTVWDTPAQGSVAGFDKRTVQTTLCRSVTTDTNSWDTLSQEHCQKDNNKNERMTICIRSGESPGELSRQNDRTFQFKRVQIQIPNVPACPRSSPITPSPQQISAQFIILHIQVLATNAKYTYTQCTMYWPNVLAFYHNYSPLGVDSTPNHHNYCRTMSG